MKIKTTMRYPLIPVQMAIISKTDNKNVVEVVEKDPLFTANGNVNWYSHYGK